MAYRNYGHSLVKSITLDIPGLRGNVLVDVDEPHRILVTKGAQPRVDLSYHSPAGLEIGWNFAVCQTKVADVCSVLLPPLVLPHALVKVLVLGHTIGQSPKISS
jgi:hypothetical protein